MPPDRSWPREISSRCFAMGAKNKNLMWSIRDGVLVVGFSQIGALKKTCLAHHYS